VPSSRTDEASFRASGAVILAGVGAALHAAKLPPAIAALQASLGVSLLQAGFLLSLVQLAGMTAGVGFGVLADGIGPRRSVLLGLGLLSAASAAGGVADGIAALMVLRAVEGFGFLLVVLPAPGLIRRLVAPERLSRVLGLWGTYMPLGTALALLAGPSFIGAFGWRAWWWMLGAVSLLAAAGFARAVPAAPHAAQAAPAPWLNRLRRTLGSPGPWLVATCFAVYSGQWLAVVGFLPTIYTQAGVSGAATGALTALAAAVNVVGNVASGRLLQAGAAPTRLLRASFVVMALSAAAAFAEACGGLPPALRYAAVLSFSMVGGMIPATLFTLAVRLAPGEDTLAASVGWVQQWSAFGQFAGPPLVAWVAARVGGWQWTWAVSAACSLAGLWLAARIARRLATATLGTAPAGAA
jgi:MFS family permease